MHQQYQNIDHNEILTVIFLIHKIFNFKINAEIIKFNNLLDFFLYNFRRFSLTLRKIIKLKKNVDYFYENI